MNLPYVVTAMIALLAVGDAALDSRGQELPIDRWLLSETFTSDSSTESRLGTDLLEAPGEVGVLPDRGTKAAGSNWSLYRNDAGDSYVSIDVLPGSVVYAHVYVRLPEDRTLRLAWSRTECTGGRLWLNGRPTEGHDFAARFGAGWNTILVKLESGDCELGFGATLTGEDYASLDDVQLQASRPPGDVRTGPEPWAIPHDTVFVSENRRWKGDRMFAGLAVRVTAWGRSALPGVRVELKGAAEGRAESSWMTPGEAVDVVVPVRLDRLDRVLAAGTLEGRVRWDGGDLVTDLVVVGQADATSSTVVLDGWDGQLPTASGSTVEGEWKVPSMLAGRSLWLVTSGSPADYTINGSAADPSAGTIPLCAPCAQGTRLTIQARSTAPWEGMPLIRAAGAVGQ